MSQDKPVLSPSEALADMFAMIDEGLLIRDISEDHKEGWAARQLKFVMRLAAAKAALSALDRQGPASGSPDLVGRLEAASHDERLSTGALYREAAQTLRALEAERDAGNAQLERSTQTIQEAIEIGDKQHARIAALQSELDRVRKDAEKWTRARVLLAQFALGYDTFNEPETCLNWQQVEELVKETRAFLTTLGERG